jgi:PAS domain S-box-containing protein
MEYCLQENEELYRTLAENAMDALIICDEKANLIYASPSMEKLSGYVQDELIGRNAFTFYHPEDVTFARERLKLLVEGKEFSSVEFRFRKKNGQYVWCEIASKTVQTKKGNLRIVVVAREITERKNLQEQLKKYSKNLEERVAERSAELKRTKEYLEQLVHSLPLAIVAWDKEFRAKTSNPEATQIFGFSEQEFLGKNLDSLFLSEGNDLAINRIMTHLQKGESVNVLAKNSTKSGKSIDCSWANTPLRDEEGNLEGVLSMIQDVTEKNELERKLKDITYNLSGVKAGESYLASSLQHCLKIAFDINTHGVKGLCVVRENPLSLIEDYNFKPEDIVLLSQKPIRGFKAVNDLQDVAILITNFLRNGGGLVVLGGLEYLISRYGFNTVFILI